MHNIHVNQVKRAINQPAQGILGEPLADPEQTPQQADSSVRLGELEQALGQLPLEQREVLLMVALEGLSYQEAAEVLSVPAGTVMSRLSRARERMRQLMQHELRRPLRSVK